jgi:YrbI family 3-deoxy-D-manno-octulosonate 8-phosphate phosphatase
MRDELTQRCQRIRLLLLDVDGVLTDGSLWFDDEGREWKRFHVRDGQGLRLWREAGGRVALVSSRRSPAVDRRAAELRLDGVFQGVDAKLDVVRQLSVDWNCPLDEIAYLGDDLVDLPPIRAVGLGAAVADAVPEVRAAAHYVTTAAGGSGAVRELIELLLRRTGRWDAALQPYAAPLA